MDPLVSIAIPTLDRLHYLKEAVASALAQTHTNIEIVIGDDGPTESIQAWSETMASQEPRVQYQRNRRRLGLAGNWNALADAARGEFLVIIGDDDRLLPDFVSRLVNAIKPAAHVAFSNHYLINSLGERLEEESRECTKHYQRHLLSAGEIDHPAATVWQNSIPMSATLFRARDAQRLRFKEDLNTPEIEFFIRVAQEGGRFVFVPEYLSEYRVHSQSATAAGLRTERLAEHLLSISVSPELEPYKRQFMAPLLLSAVNRCLQQGETELARRFLKSQYYPRPCWRQIRTTLGACSGQRGFAELQTNQLGALEGLKYIANSWLQNLCATLPSCVGSPVYRVAHHIKSVLPL